MINQRYEHVLKRADLLAISEIIPPKVRILDLGCGDGSLLRLLKEEKLVRGQGVELSEKKIIECSANGVPVVHGDLNAGLDDFRDDSFDFVVLSQTLQAVKRPDLLLDEMVRVGKKVVISFINLGYLTARLQLFLYGRMPRTQTLPNLWFNTHNIHLGTLKDFKELCDLKEVDIIDEIPLGYRSHLLAKLHPNIFAPTCVFVVAKHQ